MEKQAFGEILRELREEWSVSMRGLATAADMDPAYLSRLETGKTGEPKQETVEKLAQALCQEAQLSSDECEKLNRRLLVAGGHLQAKEDLLDDLADRFADRLRDEGFPEAQIDSALAQVPLATMRAVLLGEEKLEIGMAADYSASDIAARQRSGEEIVSFNLEAPVMKNEPVQTSMSLPLSRQDSAGSYLDRHAEDFAASRRSRRALAQSMPGRVIRAGKEASIHVNTKITKDQDQQLRLIARLINSILQEK